MKEGVIIQVIGPVVDIEFSDGNIPEVLNAIKIPTKNVETGEELDLICEVQQHLGENRVRTV
ncbi:MAG: F0F1 ATP synthase subunit beta, partial [Candidatus Kapaibacterium sp.]